MIDWSKVASVLRREPRSDVPPGEPVMPFDFISKEKFAVVEAMAFLEPPSWTRLEPQSATGDPRPGIEARVHDPLWLMGRQWQLGEFAGEDAGTPLTVRVVTRTVADRPLGTR